MHFTSKVNYKQTKTLFTRILFTCVSQWLESTVKQSSINMVEGWHTSWKKNNIFLMFSCNISLHKKFDNDPITIFHFWETVGKQSW